MNVYPSLDKFFPIGADVWQDFTQFLPKTTHPTDKSLIILHFLQLNLSRKLKIYLRNADLLSGDAPAKVRRALQVKYKSIITVLGTNSAEAKELLLIHFNKGFFEQHPG